MREVLRVDSIANVVRKILEITDIIAYMKEGLEHALKAQSPHPLGKP